MIEALVTLVKNTIPLHDEFRMAEVGVFDGETTLHYLPILKEWGGSVHLVDWWKGSLNNTVGKHRYNPEAAPTVLEELKKNINSLGCGDIVKYHCGDSVEMAKNIPDDSLDLCFIDADHHYNGVKKDILAYWPKVKVGGILCGHDYENHHLLSQLTTADLEVDYLPHLHVHPGVLMAVNELLVSRGYEVTTLEDFGPHRIPIWVLYKTDYELIH